MNSFEENINPSDKVIANTTTTNNSNSNNSNNNNNNNNNTIGNSSSTDFRTWTALSFKDKLSVLEERDKYIRQKTSLKQTMANRERLRGTCPDMCPEKERMMRELNKSYSKYECVQIDNERLVVPELLIKEYSRSSADQDEPLSHELRPEPVLTMTMRYLLNNVLSKVDEECKDNACEWYYFCCDRLRGIRKDIIQQQLCNRKIVSIIEQCARFHIWCYDMFCCGRQYGGFFEDSLNTDNLVNSLQLLFHMYDDLAACNEPRCRNESEFRVYMALLQLDKPEAVWLHVKYGRMKRLDGHVIDEFSRIYCAYSQTLYKTFFDLVASTSYLNACILQRYFGSFRIKALKTIVASHCTGDKSAKLSLRWLRDMLKFDDLTDTATFLNQCGFPTTSYNIDGDDDDHIIVMLSKANFSQPRSDANLHTSYDIVKAKRIGLVNLLNYYDDCDDDRLLYRSRTVHTSFSADNVLNDDSIDASDQKKTLLSRFENYEPEQDNVLKSLAGKFHRNNDIIIDTTNTTTTSNDNDNHNNNDNDNHNNNTIHSAQLSSNTDIVNVDSDLLLLNRKKSIELLKTVDKSSPFNQLTVQSIIPNVGAEQRRKLSTDIGTPLVKRYRPSITTVVEELVDDSRFEVKQLSTVNTLNPIDDDNTVDNNSIIVARNNNNNNNNDVTNNNMVELQSEDEDNYVPALITNKKQLKRLRDSEYRRLMKTRKNNVALKYATIWKNKLKRSFNNNNNNNNNIDINDIVNMAKIGRSIKWSSPDSLERPTTGAVDNLCARLRDRNLAGRKISAILNSPEIRPPLIGPIIAGILTEKYSLPPTEDVLLFWKGAIFLPDVKQSNFRSFAQKVKEICQLSINVSSTNDELLSKDGDNIFVRELRYFDNIASNDDRNEIEISIGSRILYSMTIADDDYYYDDDNKWNGIIVISSARWESNDRLLTRLDRILCGSNSSDNNSFPLLLVLIQTDLDSTVTAYLRNVRERNLISSFEVLKFAGYHTILNAVCKLARMTNNNNNNNSDLYRLQTKQRKPYVYVSSICKLLTKIRDEFFCRLNAHEHLIRIDNRLKPNTYVRFYNRLLFKMAEQLTRPDLMPGYEFVAYFKSTESVNDRREAICRILNTCQLRYFVKRPQDYTRSDDLLLTLRKYCYNLSATDNNNTINSGRTPASDLYANLLRIINPSPDEKLSELTERIPWLNLIEIWSSYSIRTSLDNDENRNLIVYYDIDSMNELTKDFWWVHEQDDFI